VSGLVIGIAMFGALAYLPTYLQMVTGVDATNAGLLLIPLMAGLLVTSIGSGQLVSETGRYKWLPIVGTAIVAVSLVLLSTMTPALAVWIICAYLAIMGIGLGMCMQILILIVRNSFPVSEVGTATSSNNYFRQIGASLGAAIVGSLFATKLTQLLAERLPAGAGAAAGGSNSFTPAAAKNLPLRFAMSSSAPTTMRSPRSSSTWCRSWSRPRSCWCSSRKSHWLPRSSATSGSRHVRVAAAGRELNADPDGFCDLVRHCHRRVRDGAVLHAVADRPHRARCLVARPRRHRPRAGPAGHAKVHSGLTEPSATRFGLSARPRTVLVGHRRRVRHQQAGGTPAIRPTRQGFSVMTGARWRPDVLTTISLTGWSTSGLWS
jgi:hypothetical protein